VLHPGYVGHEATHAPLLKVKPVLQVISHVPGADADGQALTAFQEVVLLAGVRLVAQGVAPVVEPWHAAGKQDQI